MNINIENVKKFFSMDNFAKNTGIIIESIRLGRYLTEVGRTFLLITWSLEPVLYLYIAYLGGSWQANQPFDEKTNSWVDYEKWYKLYDDRA